MAADEKRTVQTVLVNKSGSLVIEGFMKLNGVRDGYQFNLTSMALLDPSSNVVEKVMKVAIDYTSLHNRAEAFGYVNKLLAKIHSKFDKYQNLGFNTDNEQKQFIVFTYQDDEFITSPKKAIKLEKQVGIYVRTLKAIASYIDKMIAKKEERQKVLAERRAEKAAIAKESAEAVAPGVVIAAPIASEAVTGIPTQM